MGPAGAESLYHSAAIPGAAIRGLERHQQPVAIGDPLIAAAHHIANLLPTRRRWKNSGSQCCASSRRAASEAPSGSGMKTSSAVSPPRINQTFDAAAAGRRSGHRRINRGGNQAQLTRYPLRIFLRCRRQAASQPF